MKKPLETRFFGNQEADFIMEWFLIDEKHRLIEKYLLTKCDVYAILYLTDWLNDAQRRLPWDFNKP